MRKLDLLTSIGRSLETWFSDVNFQKEILSYQTLAWSYSEVLIFNNHSCNQRSEVYSALLKELDRWVIRFNFLFYDYNIDNNVLKFIFSNNIVRAALRYFRNRCVAKLSEQFWDRPHQKYFLE